MSCTKVDRPNIGARVRVLFFVANSLQILSAKIILVGTSSHDILSFSLFTIVTVRFDRFQRDTKAFKVVVRDEICWPRCKPSTSRKCCLIKSYSSFGNAVAHFYTAF